MRAVVVNKYRDPVSGEYVSPTAEVDLSQQEFERLRRANCVKGKAGRKPKSEAE